MAAAIGATGVALAARAVYQHRGGRDSKKQRQRTIRRAHRMNSTGGNRGGLMGKLGKAGNGKRAGGGAAVGKAAGKKAGGKGLASRSTGLASKNKGLGKSKAAPSKSKLGASTGKRAGGGLGKSSSGASKRGGGLLSKSSGASRRGGSSKSGKGLFGRSSGGRSGRGGGLLGKLGKNSRTGRAAARNASAGDRLASKAVKRSRRATMWRELKRIGTTMRALKGNRKKTKKDKDGLFRSLGHGLRAFGAWVAMAAVATGGGLLLAGKTIGTRARSLWSDIVSALKFPFEGLGTDVRRIRSAAVTRIRSEAVRLGVLKSTTTSTNTNNEKGEEVSDLNLPPRSAGPDTNLTPLIEAINEGGALGGGEQPHAKVVHQWHRDLETLLVAIKERVSADAEIAAETLPSEGSAHEITASLSDVLDSASSQTAESTNAWELCQGSRLTRLYSDDAREAAWDRSTSPD